MGIINKNKLKQMVLKGGILIFGLVGLLTPSFQKASAAGSLDARDWLNYIVEIAGAYMDQYFSMVHFNVAGNDFGGGILWLPVEQITGEVVDICIPSGVEVDENGISKTVYDCRYCSSKVRGFYWNSQRGDNRLWPMDDKTHEWLKDINPDNDKYAGLTITGGWYTTCSEDKTTVELNSYLEDNGIGINLQDLKDIVAELSKYEKDQWGEHIDGILNDNYHLGNNAETKQKIKDAILAEISFDIDSYGIYGNITHNYKWEKIDLIAGAHYDMEQNRIATGHLTCSLQRLSNNYPFGYVYDDYGHIGLIGARIASNYIQGGENSRDIAKEFHQGLNQLFNTGGNEGKGICINQIFGFDGKDMKLMKKEMNRPAGYDIPGGRSDKIGTLASFLNAGNGTARTTVFSLGIKGIVGLTDEVRDSQKQYFENNQLQSTLMLRTETSISNIVNSVSKNAERICRGKWQEDGLDWDGPLPNVICLSGTNATNSVVAPTPKKMSGKTIVVKNADLVVNMDPSGYQLNNDSIDLFIDRGNLLLDIPESINLSHLRSFDDYGYLVSESEIKAMFLKGNFVINGLMLGGATGDDTINHRLYMHGKLVSYNTITVPTANRKRTIASIIGRGWTEDSVPVGTSLSKLFNWSCNAVSGMGTDGTSCKGSSAVGKESQLVDKAFGLIDMDIKSDLIKY